MAQQKEEDIVLKNVRTLIDMFQNQKEANGLNVPIVARRYGHALIGLSLKIDFVVGRIAYFLARKRHSIKTVLFVVRHFIVSQAKLNIAIDKLAQGIVEES